MTANQRLIDVFMELVRTDSESGQEEAVSQVLKTKFSELGLQLTEDDAKAKTGHGANNQIWFWPGTPGLEQAEGIFFTCHMDTVAPGRGIQPRLDPDGFLRSDGTTILGSDDKAGIAALLEAVRTVQEKNIPHGPVQIILTVGEEKGLVGSRALARHLINAVCGFALDSNGSIGDICVAAPAQCKMQATIHGRAAHAGVNPEDGISAIQVASRAISRMPLGRIDSETTANIGRFEGGGETNIVCDQARISAEARSLDAAKLQRQIAAMKSAFEQAAEENGARAEVVYEIIYPAYKHGDDAAVVKLAVQAVERIGKAPRTFRSGGGSDANIFNGMGVPTVNLALGYEHIHTTKERIKASDLQAASDLAVAIIQCAGEA